MLKNRKCLILCIAISLALCFGQIRGSTLLILATLALYVALLAWECVHDRTLPVLLFFLPWSPLMRTGPGNISVYTIGLMMVCLLVLVKRKFWLRSRDVLIGLALVVMTLLSKMLDESGLSLSYIAFLMLILFLPTIMKESRSRAYNFHTATIFFAIGVVLAALCAQRFVTYPNIRRYIRVDAYLTITRLCGFYGDPNFYCAQITAALSGVLLMLLHSRGRKAPIQIVLAVLLVYCGLLSGSKSFVLVLACVLLAWLLMLMRMRGRGWFKIAILILAVFATIMVLQSSMFQGLIDIVMTRFSWSKNLSGFTTGRIELWRSYIKEILENPKVLLIGKGYSDALVNGRASHNSILQAIFQFGLAGTGLLVAWCWDLSKGVSPGKIFRSRHLGSLILLALGIYLPWMAIDILFFDEFFLLQWYLLLEMQEEIEYNDKEMIMNQTAMGGNVCD